MKVFDLLATFKENLYGSRELPHDNEVMHFNNRYVGEIRNGLFHGTGKYDWPNGDTYVGEYQDGRRNGIGDMAYADGDTYRGRFKDGKYHGQGEYT